MDKLSIIVVLYNCEIKDSQTLAGIAAAKIFFEQSNIIIWNNGHKALLDNNTEQLTKLGFNVFVEETVNNHSLAEIYNAFIQKYPAKHYIILDDDSSITSNYLNQLKYLQTEGIAYPIILSGGKPCSPKINRKKLLTNTQPEIIKFNNADKVEAIGSGLIISDQLAQQIRSHYGDTFDERFYIYGVDTTFCWRVAHTIPTSKITVVQGFSHSVSRNDIESKAVKLFRKIEKANAKGLKIQHYQSSFRKWFKVSQLLVLLCIPFYRQQINKQYLGALISGKHLKDRSSK